MQNLSHIIFGNYILTVSLFAWTVAQLLKTVINTVLCGRFQAERLWGAGGMPSSHSALVCALAVSAAKSEGMASPIFAIALVLAAIVMYDATGVRRETGNQAKVLNLLMDEWVADEDEPLPGVSGKKLKEKVGHTPVEVLSGALLGTVLALAIPMKAGCRPGVWPITGEKAFSCSY